jgi:hypothetical protein
LLLTGSGFAMGVVGRAVDLPDLLIGSGRAYADQLGPRKMMLWSDRRPGDPHGPRAIR